MRIGIGIPNQVRNVNPAIIPEWSVRAEQAGFSKLGTIGRFAYPGVSDTVALATAAGATSTIGLFSGVMIATTWPAELLAKELAGIDGVSGGRLSLGVGIGGRPDDFVAEGAPIAGRGKRFDHDLEVYREIWQGGPVGGGPNPAVPAGTRELPLLFGGSAPARHDWSRSPTSPSPTATRAAPTCTTTTASSATTRRTSSRRPRPSGRTRSRRRSPRSRRSGPTS
jgi:alkanesulfonate monooxygenase SsuD/methylene tetrahydromethanopterin reductase-like flavin-dependent oxidoreductase (luciferase family)